MLDPLKLEFQSIVSWPTWVLGTQRWSLSLEQALLVAESSPQSQSPCRTYPQFISFYPRAELFHPAINGYLSCFQSVAIVFGGGKILLCKPDYRQTV